MQLLPETAVSVAREHTTTQQICGTVLRNELQSGTWETREGRVCVTVERKAAPTVQQHPFAYRVCETVDKHGLKSTTRGTGEGRACVTVAKKVEHWGPGNKVFRPQGLPPPPTHARRATRARVTVARDGQGAHTCLTSLRNSVQKWREIRLTRSRGGTRLRNCREKNGTRGPTTHLQTEFANLGGDIDCSQATAVQGKEEFV